MNLQDGNKSTYSIMYQKVFIKKAGGAKIEATKNEKTLVELNKLYEQRGVITKAQIEYARSEIRALQKLFPIKKASEEVRRPYNRTLESYLSFNALTFESS